MRKENIGKFNFKRFVSCDVAEKGLNTRSNRDESLAQNMTQRGITANFVFSCFAVQGISICFDRVFLFATMRFC